MFQVSCKAFHMLTHLNLTRTLRVRCCSSPVLLMRKLKHRDELMAQAHTASTGQSWDLKAGILPLESQLLVTLAKRHLHKSIFTYIDLCAPKHLLSPLLHGRKRGPIPQCTVIACFHVQAPTRLWALPCRNRGFVVGFYTLAHRKEAIHNFEYCGGSKCPQILWPHL